MNHPTPVATFIQRCRERLSIILDTLEALGRGPREHSPASPKRSFTST